MKPKDSLIRAKQFQVTEKHRQVNQLDTMLSEFERMAGELDMQIAHEEKKSGITDTGHFAYPTFAKAARERRDNLYNSIADLQSQKEAAEAALMEAEAELQKAEKLDVREARRVAEEQQAKSAYDRQAMIG